MLARHCIANRPARGMINLNGWVICTSWPNLMPVDIQCIKLKDIKKLGEHDFCKLLSSYDIFFSECWVNSRSTFDLVNLIQGSTSFMHPLTRDKGGRMVILIRDYL